MTLQDITNIANVYTDENFLPSKAKSFVDTAISKINVVLKTTLPLIDSVEAYTALTDDWIISVIVPHVCWAIKMNDSSLNEAGAYLYEFNEGLSTLKKNRKMAISDEYRSSNFQTVYEISRYKGM